MTILLHGFWGQPAHWNQVLKRLPLGLPVLTPDLHEGELSARYPLKDWGQNFWRWVDETVGERQVQLVGYSMGGRLAVCAATHAPERVARALFLSANPLAPLETPIKRAAWEDTWAQKFLSLDWPALESGWQEQAVFGGGIPVARRKSPELREILGLTLKNWSPRLHPFTPRQIQALPKTMEWAFGASDQKYMKIAKSLQELPVQGQITIIPEAGHRLVTQAADFITQWMVTRAPH
jgi:2-succinyl-6-hydroxy-2,4-cyclohexadiene-1-carboxylate synthase